MDLVFKSARPVTLDGFSKRPVAVVVAAVALGLGAGVLSSSASAQSPDTSASAASAVSPLSAPSSMVLSPDPVVQDPVIPPSPPASSPVVDTASLEASLDTSPAVPWALDPNIQPWPLHFPSVPPMATLWFPSLPSGPDAKMMLPGEASQAAAQARESITTFFSRVLSVSSELRGGEQEQLNDWLTRTGQQEAKVGQDEWARYEFSREALVTVVRFRDQVAGQTQPDVDRLATQVRTTALKIAPLVNLMPTYELRMDWYNNLVALRDGVNAYQEQVGNADHQLLATLDDYIMSHPLVPRPEGTPPQRPGPMGMRAQQQHQPSLAETGDNAMTDGQQQVQRKPAAIPVKPEAPSHTGATLLLFAFAAAAGAWVWLKLKGRKSGKPAKANS
jgi:hypothetical protein